MPRGLQYSGGNEKEVAGVVSNIKSFYKSNVRCNNQVKCHSE